MNQLFIYGHSYFKPIQLTLAPFNHIFATTVNLRGNEPILGAGLNFGSPHGFDRDGTMGGQKLTQAFALPISQASYDRFQTIISTLRALDERDLSPYYFARYETPHVAIENSHTGSIDLYGNKRDRKNLRYETEELPVSATGRPVQPGTDKNFHRDIKYSYANCLTMTNFIAKLSGIDIAQINPDLPNVPLDTKLYPILEDTFKAGAFKVKDDDHFFYERFKSEGGNIGWKIRSDGERRTVDQFLKSAVEVNGGMYKFAESMQSGKPFDCKPIKIPESLKHCIQKMADRELQRDSHVECAKL